MDKQANLKDINGFRLNWDEEFKRQEVGTSWKKTDFNSNYIVRIDSKLTHKPFSIVIHIPKNCGFPPTHPHKF